MPILDCIVCSGTGYTRKPKPAPIGIWIPNPDLGEQCYSCAGKGKVLQDSSSFPCGGVATVEEREEAAQQGLRRI